jgi:predicted nucleic acid-binding protein
MTSLSFPDVNVWLAVLLADHVYRAPARKWWESDAPAIIAFSRFTQIGVLRLLTTAAAQSKS